MKTGSKLTNRKTAAIEKNPENLNMPEKNSSCSDAITNNPNLSLLDDVHKNLIGDELVDEEGVQTDKNFEPT
jgi:hypothetical protein